MYKKHKDPLTGKWGIYRIVNSLKQYTGVSFDDEQTAQDYCDINNGFEADHVSAD